MYRLCAVILTLSVARTRYLCQFTTDGIVCTCSGSWLYCTLDKPNDFVNITEDHYKSRISRLKLYVPQNTNLSSTILLGTTRLSHFIITGEYLKYVSEKVFLGHEGSLKSLSIENGKLDGVPVVALRHLHRLKTLSLEGNAITFVDCSLQHLNLTLLLLENNEISTVYECAFPASLHKLHLDNNRLKTLNGSLKGHKYLRKLYLEGNKISSLEGELEGMDSLHYLDAIRNNIETVGTTPVRLDELKYLDLSHNHISELGNSLNGFINLVSLYISYNNLENLTITSFVNLTELRYLGVSDNRICNIDNGAFGRLAKLEYLIISNNRLKSLDGKLNGLNSLKRLYASENRIRVIGSVFMDGCSLEKLNLSYNRIRYLGNSLCTLSQLVTLDLTYNQIEYISENNFYGLKSLRALNIARNVLGSSVNGTAFACLTNLTFLNLSWTRLNLQRLVVSGFMGIKVNSTSLLTHITNNSTQGEFISSSRKLTKTLWMEGNDVRCVEPLNAVLEENQIQLKGCR